MAARDASGSRQPGLGNGHPKTLGPGSTMLNAQFPARLSSDAYVTLSQLRTEITEKQSGPLSRLGGNVKSTHALICVALRVAFENVSGHISSVPGSEAERHLIDCLDIIQVVVDTAPESLVENLDPDVLGRDIQAPFYAWLLVQLIDLGSRVRLEIVQEKIKGLLELIVHSQNRMSRLSYSRYAISTFLGIIVTGM
jgi:serine/threonine-protein kinase ATR